MLKNMTRQAHKFLCMSKPPEKGVVSRTARRRAPQNTAPLGGVAGAPPQGGREGKRKAMIWCVQQQKQQVAALAVGHRPPVVVMAVVRMTLLRQKSFRSRCSLLQFGVSQDEAQERTSRAIFVVLCVKVFNI